MPEPNLEISERWQFKPKKPSLGGVLVFSGTTQLVLWERKWHHICRLGHEIPAADCWSFDSWWLMSMSRVFKKFPTVINDKRRN